MGGYSICCKTATEGDAMKSIISEPVFGVLISLIAFEFGSFINKKAKTSIFNPLLIAIILLIIFLKAFNISYEDYNKGGALISFFLGPATVVLAVPLYKKFSLFKKNAIPILVGIISGAVIGMVCVIMLSRVFGFSDILIKSLLPKSITTPIGIVVSKQLGGLPAITVVAIILTGITGSIIGPLLSKWLKVNDKVALGIAMGNASHAIGTSKAFEMGEIEGAMSGLTIGIAGILTVFLAPIIWQIYHYVFK
jgi:predicted murein hydrolase (TIGR00659 family)